MTNRPKENNMNIQIILWSRNINRQFREKYIEMTYEQRYLISLMINETQIKTTKPLFEHSIARFRRLQCTVLMRV